MINSSINALYMPPIMLIYRCPKLGYTHCYQSITPNYPTLVAPILFSRGPDLPIIPMYTQINKTQVLAFILNPASSKRSPANKLPHPPLLLMIPPATSLDIPQYQIVQHSNIPWHSLSSTATLDKISPWSKLMNVDNLFIDYEVIVETNGGYSSSINGQVKCPHQTINNLICIQLLYCWYSD